VGKQADIPLTRIINFTTLDVLILRRDWGGQPGLHMISYSEN
jgi:hypothetical protein